ncbi:MAG: hypothetical protein ABI895_34720 [Deltaproteobacteria bacterium]
MARALYRAEFAAGGNPVRLQALADVGGMLRRAPDTIGHRASWMWAEQATVAPGEFVTATEAPSLAAVLRASARRLRTGS